MTGGSTRSGAREAVAPGGAGPLPAKLAIVLTRGLAFLIVHALRAGRAPVEGHERELML